MMSPFSRLSGIISSSIPLHSLPNPHSDVDLNNKYEAAVKQAEQGNETDAVKTFKALAENGHVPSMAQLVLIYTKWIDSDAWIYRHYNEGMAAEYGKTLVNQLTEDKAKQILDAITPSTKEAFLANPNQNDPSSELLRQCMLLTEPDLLTQRQYEAAVKQAEQGNVTDAVTIFKALAERDHVSSLVQLVCIYTKRVDTHSRVYRQHN